MWQSCLLLDVLASQNPSMLTMALRRVNRPDDVCIRILLSSLLHYLQNSLKSIFQISDDQSHFYFPSVDAAG